ncbi:dihydroorotase family protein [Halomicroarcula sp. GCM10025817]|uniref:dihydroorotase n=1 Tax=Haloarcula TaxID=2237 RepID=UPI0023E7A754|nr:amidohydrolase family protein [Halomicroarcula sp. SYNS111]
MAVDTIIAGGTLVQPDGTYDASIAIDDETIVAVGARSELPDARRTVDATGKLVMPGAVDVHVHLDDMFSNDTYDTASRAAALGGTTTFIDFAWQAWVSESSIFEEESSLLEGIERKQEKAEGSLIDYSLHGAITREDPAVFDELPEIIEAGVTSIKMFTAYEHGLPNGFINEVLQEAAGHDLVAVLHTEDSSVCEVITEAFKREGNGEPEYYPMSRPDYAEAMAADDALTMAMEAGCRYYGIHTTCRKAADVIEDHRDDYHDRVRAETCTQYTVADDSLFSEVGLLPMAAPPLRKPDDNDAMFEHLDRGTLDVVSTDHCGYTRDQKQVEPWWEGTFGMNSLQRSLPVFYDEAVEERGFSPSFVVAKLASNPARIFGMPDKGTLDPGTDADVVVFDPDDTAPITPADNESMADFSVYEGREVGRIAKTFVRGELLADDGDVVGESGHGEFVHREIPDWEQ